MAHASLIVRNAQVLLPSGEIAPRDVALSNGKIAAVGSELSEARLEPNKTGVIDGSGLTMLPGVIDPCVHFEEFEQAGEDLFAATCACVKGGITSFLEVSDGLLVTSQGGLEQKLAIAASQSLANYGFFATATANNLLELQAVNSTCGIRIPKHLLDAALLEDATIEPIFALGDRLIATSANSPNVAKLALALSKKYQRRLHLSQLSAGEDAELLRRDKPSWVTAEVTPQHLLLDANAYEDTEIVGMQTPENLPLQSERDRELLWQALLDGVIDFIATDHRSPARAERPQKPSGFGIPGVETALPLMLTQAKENRCTVAQVSSWMSTAVAQAYQIASKGLIEPGYDADLVLVDLTTYRPVLREELKASARSPFEGWTLTGWPVVTLLGGQIVYNRGEINQSVRGQALAFE